MHWDWASFGAGVVVAYAVLTPLSAFALALFFVRRTR